MKDHYTTIRKAKGKKRDNTKCWWCGKTGSLIHCCGNIKCYSFSRKHFGSLLKTKITQLLYNSATVLTYLNQRHENVYTHKCIYKCFHNRTKLEPALMSLGEWLNKLWYVCIVKFYSAASRSGLLVNAETWMNLQRKILSGKKKKPISKVTYCD